jgi:hypothetical protein
MSSKLTFLSILYCLQLEGTFELYSPPVLLGYQRGSKDVRNTTFLTLFVTVHPPLQPPKPIQVRFIYSNTQPTQRHNLFIYLCKQHPIISICTKSSILKCKDNIIFEG